MKDLDFALQILEKHRSSASEHIPLHAALNRTLAEDVFSDINMPPFNKSAMDGYACRKEDLGKALDLIETIPAGKTPTLAIGAKQCAKIMTGAPVPDGADMVFMLEDSQVLDGKILCANPHSKANICYTGEDIAINSLVLQKRTFIKAHHIAIMASVGYTNVLVQKLPTVGVISTGTELVEPHVAPASSQIRNSNGSQVLAQLQQLGIAATYYGIANDEEGILEALFTKATAENDIIILTGGVSSGDFDLVPAIVQNAGFTIEVSKMAIQPGKPVMIATNKNKICFGLSGNPVSSFVQFNLLVKYYILGKNMQIFSLPLAESFERKKGQRVLFVPVQLENGLVKPVIYNGSAHIGAFANADGIMEIPKGITQLKKGSIVHVRQI